MKANDVVFKPGDLVLLKKRSRLLGVAAQSTPTDIGTMLVISVTEHAVKLFTWRGITVTCLPEEKLKKLSHRKR